MRRLVKTAVVAGVVGIGLAVPGAQAACNTGPTPGYNTVGLPGEGGVAWADVGGVPLPSWNVGAQGTRGYIEAHQDYNGGAWVQGESNDVPVEGRIDLLYNQKVCVNDITVEP